MYTSKAQKDLLRINKLDSRKILKKLDEIINLDSPLSKAKKLKNFRIDTYRFRIGSYRVIFRKDEKTQKLVILVVLKIAHRQGVYN